MKKIHVDLKENSYDILICSDAIRKLGGYIKRLRIGKDALIITNPRLKKLFGQKIYQSLGRAGINTRFQIIPGTEKAKSQKYCARLLNNISRIDSAKKQIFIMALGGGVVGDLAGFVASIYKRGMPYIQVPTTLLAQVDSAIGGKVAIDLDVGKNLAGSFYQPKMVYSDVIFLKTLPSKELVSGMAEVIKYGIIGSPRLFEFLEKNYKKILSGDEKSLQRIIYECSSIKSRVVEKDERDIKNIRVMLNLGHTIGHAIEAATHYGSRYSHGQAVALGILAVSYMSERLGLLDEYDYARIKKLIKDVGLQATLKGARIKDLLAAQEHDKKFIHGYNRLVLPVKIGKVMVKENVPKSLIGEAVEVLYK